MRARPSTAFVFRPMSKMLFLAYEGRIVPKARMNTQGKATKRSRDYLESQKSQAWVYKQQAKEQGWNIPDHDECLSISAFFFFKDDRVRDIDNLLGAVQDAIQYAGLIENDKQIKVIQDCAVFNNSENDMVLVVLSEIDMEELAIKASELLRRIKA